jgi:hypothetical protein
LVRLWSVFGPSLVRLWSRLWSVFGPSFVRLWSVFGPSLVREFFFLVPSLGPSLGRALFGVFSMFGPSLVRLWSVFGPSLVPSLVRLWSVFGPSLVRQVSGGGSPLVDSLEDLVPKVTRFIGLPGTCLVLSWVPFQSVTLHCVQEYINFGSLNQRGSRILNDIARPE